MNANLHRFLSRREKRSAPKAVKKPDHFGGIFTYETDSKRPDKEQEKRVESILDRLRHHGIDNMVESNVEYALRATGTNGDGEAAFKLLMLLQDTYEGIVKQYNPETRLIGAQNREGVTCYLDALLFAMFARLDSFEALLYDSFQDLQRKKLAGLLRLWVNMLRTGRLVTVDVTKQLQEALAECGWQDAASLKQQDPSEAFTFITGQLELPLLTLKMDLYHTGKEDPHDDHKFVNERLLEVAIADQPREGNRAITLEDCLEQYFNNRIEVKRHIENMRRNTLKSGSSAESYDEPAIRIEKESGLHVEVAELESPGTPLAESPFPPDSPAHIKDPLAKLRPGSGRARAESIFGQRKIELVGIDPDHKTGTPGTAAPQDRKLSLRTEVLMPAWQFFKLLPWYTDSIPDSDAQVAAHFSKKRPVLGICLKRYSYTNTGQASRVDTYVDIPLEIAVPNFVGDDNMQDDGPLVGNFRLMLQSVVCHRGVSVHSGHYITLCRGTAANAMFRGDQIDGADSSDSEDGEDPWIRFDDLAKDRISRVDIREALRLEMPYLLFYQVQPIGDDGSSVHDLPTYAEATSRSHSDVELQEKICLNEPPSSEGALAHSTSNLRLDSGRTETSHFAPQSERNSFDANVAPENDARGRSSVSVGPENRTGSITLDQSSFGGSAGSIETNRSSASLPSTPPDERTAGFLAVASKIGTRRGSRRSKSRPTSAGLDTSSRFSMNMNMTKLARGLGNSKAEAPAVQNIPLKTPDEKGPFVISTTAMPESVTTAKPVTNPNLQKERRKERGVERGKKTGRHKGVDGEDRDCVLM